MPKKMFTMNARNINTFIVSLLVLLVAFFFGSNQYLMEQTVSKNEHFFNENQFIQTSVAATAITKSIRDLDNSANILLQNHFPPKKPSDIVHQFSSRLSVQPSCDAYYYFSSPDKVYSAVTRSKTPNNIIYKQALELNRSSWTLFTQNPKQKINSSTYLSRNAQLLFRAHPVMQDKSLKGILIQVINLRPLIEWYILPLRSGQYGAGFALSGNGTIIYDHEEEIIGKNVFNGMHDSYPQLIELDRRLISEKSGKSEYSFTIKRSDKISRKLISWNTVDLGNDRLVICLSAPDFEVDANLSETRTFQIISQTLLLLMIILTIYVYTSQLKNEIIHKNEKRLVLAMEGNRDGVWDWDVLTSEVYFSKRWKEMLGYEDHEIHGSLEEWETRVHPDDKEKVMIEIKQHLAGETPFYENEHRVRCKDGSYIWILDRGKVYMHDKSGKPARMIGTHTDITEKKEHELKFTQLSMAVENSPSAVVITDKNGLIEYVNESFEHISKFSSAESIGKNCSELIKAESNENHVYEELWRTISSGNLWRGELINRAKDGHEYWCRLSISPLFNELGEITNYIGIQEDLTEIKEKEAKLNKLATTDELTETNNRRSFMSIARNELQRSQRSGRPVVLVIMDIDHFKSVNDNYGHDFGDVVLQQLSTLVKSSIRSIDTFGRIGGEEFALILPETSNEGARILLERLRIKIEQNPITHNGTTIYITASLGYTEYKENEPLLDIMKRADRALYKAKEGGRNKIVSCCEETDS